MPYTDRIPYEGKDAGRFAAELKEFEVLFKDGNEDTVIAEFYLRKNGQYQFFAGGKVIKFLPIVYVESVR